jgi:drug/metabolite transporter (DMT)-like permease
MSSLNRTSHLSAVGLLLLTALLWSFGGVLIKWVDLHPLAIAGLRSAIAAPVLLVFWRSLRFDWSKTQIGAALAYTGVVMLFVSSTKLTTAANAILLQYTAPVFVALLSWWLLRERIRWFDWLTIAVTLCGMLLFFVDKLSAGGMLGNLLSICSGVAFATMIVLLRKQKDGSPLTSVFMGNVLTAIICIPWYSAQIPTAYDWLGLVLLGVFQLGLSYVVYSIAIKRVTAIEGILIPIIEPVLNPLWVMLVLGEVPAIFALIGGSIIVVMVAVWSVVKIGPFGQR